MLTLPAFVHSLPHPHHAPDPKIVAALLGPLEVLCPLLEESNDYGIALISLKPEPRKIGTGQENLHFIDIRSKATSAHERLHNPWLRPGPYGKQSMLAQASLAFSQALIPIFGQHLTQYNILACRTRPLSKTVTGFRITIADLSFCVPNGPQAPLLVAAVFAVLHSIVRNGRPTAEVFGGDPAQRYVMHGAIKVHIGPSTLPGTDDADRQRFRTEAFTFRQHLAAAFSTSSLPQDRA